MENGTPITHEQAELRRELPGSTLALVQTLTNYKAWANEVLYSGLCAIPESARTSDFELISVILDHCLVVDLIFQAHLQAIPHGYGATRGTGMRSLEAFAQRALEIDQWYIDYAANVSEPTLLAPKEVRFTDGKTFSLSPAEMILHVVNHGTYHRGNVGVVLHKCGIVPYRDGLPDYFARTRAVP